MFEFIKSLFSSTPEDLTPVVTPQEINSEEFIGSKIYNFYQWNDTSASLILSQVFSKDSEAIAKLAEFPEGDYEITVTESVSASVAHNRIVLPRTAKQEEVINNSL